jgi:TonB family protein
MTQITTWLVHCVLIAAVLSGGAALWEGSARWSGRSVRWAWLAAMVGSVLLPWALQLVPERVVSDVVVSALPAYPTVVAEPGPLTGAVAGLPGRGAAEYALALWALLSTMALAVVALMVARMKRSQRRWRAADMDGTRVWVARDTGPAALGVRRGVVVVPAWVAELAEELRSLLLLHEREHLRAGDPRTLLGALLLVAAMPWNPLVWYQFVRLRNAIELDCDARVLRRGVDPRTYGALLLEVGRRRARTSLVLATFAEPRMFLETRIRRIARWPLDRRPPRAFALAAAALVLFAGAVRAGDALRPLEYVAAEVESTVFEEALPVSGIALDALQRVPARPLPVDTPPADTSRRPTLTAMPTFTPMTERPELLNGQQVRRALAEAYPPALRAAAVEGTSVVWFHISEQGRVLRTMLSRSSGVPALDEAALKVGSLMEFSPAKNRDRDVAVWVEIPLVFSADGASRVAGDGTARVDPATGLVRIAQEAPRLLNTSEVVRMLMANYPPLLRDAGVGGSVVVWYYISEQGQVQRTQVGVPSGHRALDELAVSIAASMRFSPRVVEGARMATWVAVPFSFNGVAPVPVETTADLIGLPPVYVPMPAQERSPDLRVDTVWTTERFGVPPTQRPPQTDISAAPTFTPFTTKPELTNSAEVQRLLIRHYPPLLRDAGIGGAPVIWVFVDTEGRVQRTQLSKTSGYPALDDAALAVAPHLRYSPALNRSQVVAVWIEVPVVFSAR